jgi:hypothetical protein
MKSMSKNNLSKMIGIKEKKKNLMTVVAICSNTHKKLFFEAKTWPMQFLAHQTGGTKFTSTEFRLRLRICSTR